MFSSWRKYQKARNTDTTDTDICKSFTEATKSRYKGQSRPSFEGNSTAERVGSYRLGHYLWCRSNRYLWK